MEEKMTVADYIRSVAEATFNENSHGYSYRYIDKTEHHDGKSIIQYYEVGTEIGSSSFGIEISVEQVYPQGTIISHNVISFELKIDEKSSLAKNHQIISKIQLDVNRISDKITNKL